MPQFNSSDQTAWASSRPVKQPDQFVEERWIIISQASNQGPYASNPCYFKKELSDQILGLDRAVVMMPYVIATTQRVGNAASFIGSPFFVAFKSAGSLTIVDRYILQVNNQTLTQNQNYAPIINNWRYLFSSSPDYHRTFGPAYLMGSELPATEVLSFGPNALSTGVNGVYNCNLINVAASANLASDQIQVSILKGPRWCNRAFWSRCVNIGQPARLEGANANPDASTANNANLDNRECVFQGVVADTVGGANGVRYTGWACIPLALMSDQFRGLGIRGWIGLNLTLFCNTCYNVEMAAGGLTMVNAGSNPVGSMCPLMVSQAGATAAAAAVNQPEYNGNIQKVGVAFGCYGLGPNDGITQAGGIQSLTTGGATYAELWAPEYKLTVNQMEEFLSAQRQVLEYFDHSFATNFPSVAANTTVSHTINGTLTSPRKLYMLLFPSKASLTNGVSAFETCIDNTPLYAGAQLKCINAVVTIEGNPIFPNQMQYGYQDFLTNVKENITTNAGLVGQFNPTLFTKDMWDVSRVYVYDTSRYVKAGTSVAVRIQWKNCNSVPVEPFYLIEQFFKGEITTAPGKTVITQLPTAV